MTPDELAQNAYLLLQPDQEAREITLRYSGHFKDYNANISQRGRHISIKLSSAWQDVSQDIQIGIIQYLLCKLLKIQKRTEHMDLYASYLKHISRLAPRTATDPILRTLFEDLNTEYFGGMMDMPNLILGTHALATLGHYHYGTDTVTISRTLLEDHELLRYVLYHELLHKKHAFASRGTRMRYHTKAFRADEASYKDPLAEKKLEAFVRRKRRTWRFF
ncbi:MAG: hypothetical protein HC945_01280 [Nitrosarchaeum sp.]|nr:hypothetical protein [Nitrosarchaeum sp.]